MKNYLFALISLLCLGTAGCFSQPVSVADTRFSMDTLVKIEASGQNETEVKQAVNQAFQAFQETANETDRYQNTGPASLFNLNQQAGNGAQPVGRHAYTLIAFLQQQPLPDVDATIGPVVDSWRRHREAKTLPSSAELDAALRLTGREKINLYPERQAVELLQPGMSLDLGAVAKGYAVDQAAAQLTTAAGISHALVNAGGNIKTIGKKPNQEDWRIAIQDPRNANQQLGILRLRPGEAAATSGDYQRYYEADGKRLHHILDRKTGMPVTHTISVTIVAETALLADYYSTLLFILPREQALAVLAEHPEIQSVIVDDQQQVYVTPQLRTRFSTN